MSQKQSANKGLLRLEKLNQIASESESNTDPNDADFIEGYLEESDTDVTHANTTPSTRIQESSTPSAAKARVDKATSHQRLAGSRCLLENTSDTNAVEYAHCYPRAIKDNILDNIEYSWGMKYRTLNLDTRYNIFRLSAKFHELFDRGLWLLIPDASVIQTYLNNLPKKGNSIKPKNLPEIPQQPPYAYTIVAHPDMRDVPLLRQRNKSIIPETNKNPDRILTLKDFEFLEYPFSNAIITSHVHPRYVICSIGWIFQKKRKLYDKYRDSDQIRDIVNILRVYSSWSTLYKTQLKADGAAALGFRQDAASGPKIDENTSRTVSRRAIPSKRQRPDSSDEDHLRNPTQQSDHTLSRDALANNRQ